ncbi:hypothetical protein BHE74_00049526 [Ensete ventricosum]|nr:hypothetical protein BHE74_00049526 [Ensete ventricosum]
MASSTFSRWLRPEVYPLFAAVGVAVGICGMQLVRNISTNPEVRFWMNICLLFYEEWWDNKSYAVTELFGCTFKVTSRLDSNKHKKNSIANHGAPVIRVNKQNRAAGVLENFCEGEKYAEHGLRKFVRNKAPEIMPAVNKFFSDPK